jgi:hypothetical protein
MTNSHSPDGAKGTTDSHSTGSAKDSPTAKQPKPSTHSGATQHAAPTPSASSDGKARRDASPTPSTSAASPRTPESSKPAPGKHSTPSPSTAESAASGKSTGPAPTQSTKSASAAPTNSPSATPTHSPSTQTTKTTPAKSPDPTSTAPADSTSKSNDKHKKDKINIAFDHAATWRDGLTVEVTNAKARTWNADKDSAGQKGDRIVEFTLKLHNDTDEDYHAGHAHLTITYGSDRTHAKRTDNAAFDDTIGAGKSDTQKFAFVIPDDHNIRMKFDPGASEPAATFTGHIKTLLKK